MLSIPVSVCPGERLAERYLVERVIGTGPKGVVLVAYHGQAGEPVALKLMSTEAADRKDTVVVPFLRAALATATLRSEHTARVIDAGTDEQGRQFIVTEYLVGQDLGRAMAQPDFLPIADVVGYVVQACEALAEAHRHGIIHGNLKPQNLFLTRRDDGSPRIKVVDFGVSDLAGPVASGGSGRARAVPVSGPWALPHAPMYLSPEQIGAPLQVDGRSDVWALGVILFELVAGRRPFLGDGGLDLLASILNDPLPAVSALRGGVPGDLEAVIHACLERDVDQRISGVGALARALAPWAPAWAHEAAARAMGATGSDDARLSSMQARPLRGARADDTRATVAGIRQAVAPAVRTAKRTRLSPQGGYALAAVVGLLTFAACLAITSWRSPEFSPGRSPPGSSSLGAVPSGQLPPPSAPVEHAAPSVPVAPQPAAASLPANGTATAAARPSADAGATLAPTRAERLHSRRKSAQAVPGVGRGATAKPAKTAPTPAPPRHSLASPSRPSVDPLEGRQ